MLFAAAFAYAGDTPSELNQRKGSGDPEIGREKSAFCQGCHGEDGNSASGTFPKLAGQWSDYIQKQFREFQNGARYNETMSDVAVTVEDFNDLFDITAYFASQKMMPLTPIDPNDTEAIKLYREGDKLFNEGNSEDEAFRCVKCHGLHGRGEPLNNNLFPVLGGQHKEYLVKQLNEFRDGLRDNDRSGMMMRITSRLTKHEIEAIATYLSSTLPPPAPVPAPVVAQTPPAPVEAWRVLLEDKPVSIEGTSFATNSAKLKKSADKPLALVLEFAKNVPDAQLDVIGYSDSSGSTKKNIDLSLARAEAVKKYLVKRGVLSSRITSQGLGPANPVADNKTRKGRALNRRVEIRSVIKTEKRVRVEVPAQPTASASTPAQPVSPPVPAPAAH